MFKILVEHSFLIWWLAVFVWSMIPIMLFMYIPLLA